MYCTKCGKKIIEGVKFCEFCGAIINNREVDGGNMHNINKIDIQAIESKLDDEAIRSHKELNKNPITFDIYSLIMMIFLILLTITWHFGGLISNGNVNVSFFEIFNMFAEQKKIYHIGLISYVNPFFHFFVFILLISCLYCFLLDSHSAMNRLATVIFGFIMMVLFIVFYIRFLKIDVNLFGQLNIFGYLYVFICITMVLFSLGCVIAKK